MSARRPPRATRGFTLLEIIVSMVILALVTGICYAAFHLGIRAVTKGEVAVVTAQRLRVATDVMVRQVKSASAVGAETEDNDFSAYYFVGTPTSMSFVTEAGQLSGGGPSWVRYTITNDPPQIVLEECPCFDARNLGSGKCEPCGWQSAVVLDGFRAAKFEFCDPAGPDGECGESCWCKGWDYLEMEQLPLAVRLSVSGLPGLDEDEWGQEIPLMAATYGDEQQDPPHDCENYQANTSTGSGSGGTGSTPGKSKSTETDDSEDDSGDD